MKKALGFILLSSLLFRLWFALGYWVDKPLTQDAREYLELAANYNATGDFAYDRRTETERIELTGRAPGYPFWLACLLRLQPLISWIRLAEVLVSIASTFLFLLIAGELFSGRSALAAFAISSFYVPLIWLIPQVLSENLWVFVMLSGYWFFLRARKETTGFSSMPAFAMMATATLIRPGTVFVIPFFVFWTLRKQGIKWAVAGFLVYVLLLLPWNLYLHNKEGRWIFVASEGGVTFWTATHPAYSGDGDLASNPAVQQEYRALLEQSGALTPTQREQLFWQKALHNISGNPGRYFVLELKKLVFWVLPVGKSVRSTSLLHQVSGILFYFAVLIPAAFGFRLLSKDDRFFFLGIVVSYTAMILVFMPQERFRIAAIDPILILSASQFFTTKSQSSQRGAT